MRRSLNHHEARAVAAILADPEYDGDDDPGRMASDIVRAINERRERERLWVVVAQPENRPATIHGPYLTEAGAMRAVGEALIGYGDTVVHVGIWRVHPNMEPAEVDDAQ